MIFFDPDKMIVFARTCFATKREDFITIERAMRITGATETELLHLRKNVSGSPPGFELA
jgi:hypothetical protein